MEVRWRRAAAYVVCFDTTGQLLLTRFVSAGNPDSGKWTLPGGGMEWGESPQETAVRELEEETGLQAEIGPILGVFSRWCTDSESSHGEPGHAMGVVFEATATTGQLRTDFDVGTTDAARWFPMDEVLELPHVELVDFALSLI